MVQVTVSRQRVWKPWGYEDVWYHDAYTVKVIHVNAGHRLSLQLHERKIETMFVHVGHPTIRLGGETLRYGPGDIIHVEAETIHRISAPDDEDVAIFEVSTPHSEDIVRLEDDYGRLFED